MVRQYEKKLEEEGIDIDEMDEDPEVRTEGADGGMGTGTAEAAFAANGEVEGEGMMATVGKVLEGLGLAGRGKEQRKKRKGVEGLLDV